MTTRRMIEAIQLKKKLQNIESFEFYTGLNPIVILPKTWPTLDLNPPTYLS